MAKPMPSESVLVRLSGLRVEPVGDIILERVEMGDDITRIEGKVDEIGRKLDKHIVESVEVRTKVNRHEELLGNGWAKELSTDISDLKLKLARIEEQLLAKGHSWRELFFGLSLVSLLIGTIINAIKLYQM